MRQRIAVLLAVCLWTAPPPARAEPADAAALMPADATVFVAIDAPALRARAERTGLWQLAHDPAMQPFMASLRAGIGPIAAEAMEEFSERIGLPIGQPLPWPQGQVAAAVKIALVEVMRERPGFDGPDGAAGGAAGTETCAQVLRAGVVLVADFGTAMEAFGQIERRAVEAAVDAGYVQRSRESCRDVEITLLRPRLTEGGSPLRGLLAYAFKGEVLVAGNDLDMIRHVLDRLDGLPVPSLGDDEGCRAMMRSLGEAQLVAYADPGRLIAGLREKATGGNLKAIELLRTTGLDGLRQAALAVDVAPDPVVQCRWRMRLTVEGPPRGVVTLLAPRTRPLRVPPLAIPPLESLCVFNYEPGELFDRIDALAATLVNPPPGMFLQRVLAATADGDRPPVSLRNDLLGRLHAPIVVLMGGAGGGGDGIVFSLAADDAAALDEAVGRVHGLTGGTRRDLPGSTLYLYPPGGRPDGDAFALTVAGDALLGGPAGALEAAVLRLRGEDRPTIEADPMFRHARRFLPAEAGVWAYTDQQARIGPLWDGVRRTAADLRARTLRPPLDRRTDMIDDLSGFMDFTLLPAFERVERHFGAAVFHLVADHEGFRAEGVLVAPPGGE
ncbi:MAG: hypothetical protein GX591_10065 [Planctomycetes bacterium]|nr:hypothetical protein [Planctomycetota bacterium]